MYVWGFGFGLGWLVFSLIYIKIQEVIDSFQVLAPKACFLFHFNKNWNTDTWI